MRRSFHSAVLLGFLFGFVPAPAAATSADLNGDGSVDISDAVHLLGYLFLGTDFGGSASDPPKMCFPCYHLLLPGGIFESSSTMATARSPTP